MMTCFISYLGVYGRNVGRESSRCWKKEEADAAASCEEVVAVHGDAHPYPSEGTACTGGRRQLRRQRAIQKLPRNKLPRRRGAGSERWRVRPRVGRPTGTRAEEFVFRPVRRIPQILQGQKDGNATSTNTVSFRDGRHPWFPYPSLQLKYDRVAQTSNIMRNIMKMNESMKLFILEWSDTRSIHPRTAPPARRPTAKCKHPHASVCPWPPPQRAKQRGRELDKPPPHVRDCSASQPSHPVPSLSAVAAGRATTIRRNDERPGPASLFPLRPAHPRSTVMPAPCPLFSERPQARSPRQSEQRRRCSPPAATGIHPPARARNARTGMAT